MDRNSATEGQEAENAKIHALASKFGFPERTDMILDSDGAIDVLRQVREFERLQSYVRQAQPLLKALSTRAIAFMSALESLNSQARKALMATEPTATDAFIQTLLHDTEQIEDIAEAALASLKAEGVGRPGEPRLKSALLTLYSLYCLQCQDPEPFKSNPSVPKGYEGKFFDFACQLFGVIGIKRSASAIGKQIQEAIQGADDADNQGENVKE